jgi:DNA-binding beta-propeller fold protein YncE
MASSRTILLLLPLLLCSIAGCGSGSHEKPEIVWGRRGVQPGDIVRPRAIAIDREDHLYIVDFTARIQVFDRDGKFLDHCWTTPDYRNGRPSGLSIDRDNNLLVCDSHYNCVRVYTIEGKELRALGLGLGLGYVSDAVQDDAGNYYLGEFGEIQRITKLDSDGKLIKRWGSAGPAPGQFARIRALALGPDGLLYVADACNHRIQVFTRDGEYVRSFGEPGSEPGKLSYPYDLAFAATGELYVVEYDNHRVQKFTKEGKSLGCWGGPGREPGRLHNPWALAIDSQGRVHVVDTENHRVQRIRF